jgi:hypothetical protein
MTTKKELYGRIDAKDSDIKWWKSLTMFIAFCLFLIVVIASNTDIQNYEFKYKYYNLEAQQICPTMQYETTEPYNTVCSVITYKQDYNYTLCGNLIESQMIPSDSPCIYTVHEEKYFNCTLHNIIKNNFTTGRYIDGKIECFNQNTEWGYVTLKNCMYSIGVICKSQIFTLEEFGLK